MTFTSNLAQTAPVPDPRSGARRYWRCLLAGAVAVSVAGNVGHAFLTAAPHLRAAAMVAAALPPVALLGVSEGLARSAGAGARRGVYRAAVAGGVVIAGLAFVLSFAALRDLAVALGQPAVVAWGWPLLADATIAVSSAMLLAIRPTETVPSAAMESGGGQSPAGMDSEPGAGDLLPAESDADALETVTVDRTTPAVSAREAAVKLARVPGVSQRQAATATGVPRSTLRRDLAAVGQGPEAAGQHPAELVAESA